MARIEKTGVQPLLIGTAFLAGIVVASLTVVPVLTPFRASIVCALGKCSDPAAISQSAATAGWVTAIVTFLAALFAGGNLYVLSMNALAERISKMNEQRAYLTVSSVSLGCPGLIPAAIIKVTNKGKTPAEITDITATMQCRYSGDTLDGAVETVNEISSPIITFDVAASDTEEFWAYFYIAHDLPQDRENQIRFYDSTVVVHVAYQDIFGRPHVYDCSFMGNIPMTHGGPFQLRKSRPKM